jgi:uncharacterized protein DUF1018
MERETGRRSAADLDPAGARRLLTVLDGLPRVPGARPPIGAPSKHFDKRPIARKVTALWLMLWNLDEVASSSDKAIAAFVKRTTGKDAVKFCTNGELGKIVEALKAWSLRAGVDPDTTAAMLDPLRKLVDEQYRRVLGHNQARPTIPVTTLLLSAIIRISLRATLDQSQLQQLANELGTEVRRLKLGRRRKEKNPPLETEKKS